ncbi:catecholate siderophore receptor CirA [Providencia vermicola]|uniref:catecholate siderophore receptor CirA n=1 Tax=Providencia vermicola TaxID=333965 RepID=UPI0032DBBA3D
MVVFNKRKVAICIIAAIAASPAFADDKEDRMIVTASSVSKESVVDAPATVTVITQEEIQRKPSQNLVDILREVPGVQFTSEGDNRKGISIRGLGSGYNLILVDGKRINSRNAVFRHNDYDLSWIPTVAIERIEVIRGPMSSLYGADALGGVINIITKKESNDWHGSLSFDSTIQEKRDHGDTNKGGFFVTGPLIKDKLDIKVYGSLAHRRADRVEPVSLGRTSIGGIEGNTTRDGNVDLKWSPAENQTVDLGYGFNRQDRESESLGNTRLERTSYSIGHKGNWDLASTELRFYGEDVDNYTTTKIKSESKVIDGKVTIPLFDHADMLTLGAEHKTEKLTDNINIKNSGSTEKKQYALFAENEWYIADPLILTTGLRMDHHEDFGQHYSPRVYLVYNATQEVTVKGGWSSAFKAPSLLDLSPDWQTASCRGGCSIVGTPDLDPETANTVELGLYYNGQEGILEDVSANVTVYQNDLKDMININRTPDINIAPTYPNFAGWTTNSKGEKIPVFKYYNVDKARIRGVETELRVPFLDKQFDLNFNYSYTDARDRTNDTPLNTKPFDTFNTTLNWYPTDAASLYVTANYQGKARKISESDKNKGGYTMWNLGGAYKLTDNVKLRAGVLNLLDKTQSVETYGYNEEGRRYFISGEYSF